MEGMKVIDALKDRISKPGRRRRSDRIMTKTRARICFKADLGGLESSISLFKLSGEGGTHSIYEIECPQRFMSACTQKGVQGSFPLCPVVETHPDPGFCQMAVPLCMRRTMRVPRVTGSRSPFSPLPPAPRLLLVSWFVLLTNFTLSSGQPTLPSRTCSATIRHSP